MAVVCILCAEAQASAHRSAAGVQSFSPPFGSTLTRLSPAEIGEYRAKLEAWQTPKAMLRFYRSLMDRMGSDDLFNQPGVDFITEAWAAAQFAIGRRARRVRL